MVSLAEKAAKKESVPDMAKVEGLMAKLSVKYATLVVSDDWTEKHTKLYKKLTAKYGKAHKVFGKAVGQDIGSAAKEFGKDVGEAGKKAGSLNGICKPCLLQERTGFFDWEKSALRWALFQNRTMDKKKCNTVLK